MSTDRLEILNNSKLRMQALCFGDPVTNVCASERNPMFHCYFVEYVRKSQRNRYGITHTDHLAKCTDKKGSFWNIGIKVIHSGHLSKEGAKALFNPVWESEYGKKVGVIEPEKEAG